MVEKQEKIWFNGKLVDWDKANVHVLAHALHYGTGVFEGIRSYEVDGKAEIFKLKEHVERLFFSAKNLKLEIPFKKEEIENACIELLEANKLKGCYIRPIVFLDEGPMGLDTRKSPVSIAIIAWPWGAYLGEDGIENGIHITVCPYRRQRNELSNSKITGSYYVSVLSKRFAVDQGFDESLMLDTEGFVAEGSGENIFMVKDEKVLTPKLGAILPGITRSEVIKIVKDLGLDFEEKDIKLDELLKADEIFFTGTAAEITPIVKIDDDVIGNGKVGDLSKKIRKIFFDKIGI